MSGALGKILTGKTIAGKLRIGEHLSEDPAGSIYHAVDIATGQKAVVLALAEGVRLGDEQEAGALKHPNILAHRLSYFPNAAQRFVATDAPTGRSLAQLIAKHGHLHPGSATNVALQILSALHAIHSVGTFHGNLNPHNVFVDKTAKGELEVCLLFPGVVRTDSLPSSPRFFAPEQILGEDTVDRRADIWAVGALLYLCLFGRPPFDGDDQEAISGKILLKDPVFPKEAEKLPADLVGSIRTALAKEPDKRPQFANNMVGDLLATAEEFDEQMSEDVTAALRKSIPPAAPAKKAPAPNAAAPKPVAQAAPRSAVATLFGAKAAPRPAAAPSPVAQAAPRPAAAPSPVAQAAPRPAAAAPMAVPRPVAQAPMVVPRPAAAVAAPAASAQVAPITIALPQASASPSAEDSSVDARAAAAHEISSALESALEINLLESIPPPPTPGARRDRLPLFLRDKKKLAIAAVFLAVIGLAIAAVALVTGGEGERAPAQAAAPATRPRKAVAEKPAPVVPPRPAPQEEKAPAVVAAPPAPAAPVSAAEPKAAAPKPSSGAPAVGSGEAKAAPVHANHEGSSGAVKPAPAKKPQPSQKKKNPLPPKGAEGLASNPFGG